VQPLIDRSLGFLTHPDEKWREVIVETAVEVIGRKNHDGIRPRPFDDLPRFVKPCHYPSALPFLGHFELRVHGQKRHM